MRNYIIGITGGSGSGKTTFIRELRKAFSEQELCVISQDDYYYPRDQQVVDDNGVSNFDLPRSINTDELHRDLLEIIDGNTVTRKEYTYNNDLAVARDKVFLPAPIIILEGIFVFNDPKLYSNIDLRIFIHADDNLKIIRRIKRDQVERNYPIDDVLYRYEHHVMPTYIEYILPFKSSADIVVNNNERYDAALEMLINSIKYKLLKMKDE